MIGIQLLGGFGNNLFQIANGAAIAAKLKTTWNTTGKPERGSYGAYYGNVFEWDRIFKFDSSIDPNFNASGLKPYYHTDMNSQSTDFSYHPVPVTDNSIYVGYFQSPKYFEGFDVKEVFRFRDDLQNTHKAYIEKIKTQLGVSKLAAFHIRIGEERPQQYHKNVSSYYYERSEQLLSSEYGILIVSDNLKLAKDFMEPILRKTNRSVYYYSGDMHNDFCMMAHTDRVILGNSTFSWWSAFLNESKESHVVPQSEWLGPGYSHFTTEDMFPKNWIKL